MAKDKLLYVGLGLGALYLISKAKPGIGQVYQPGFIGPTLPGSVTLPAGANPAGAIVGWLSNIFKGSGSSTTNPGQVPTATGGATDITDINQIGAQPMPYNATDLSSGCVNNGNPCDPNDCSYVPGFCDQSGTYQ